MKLYSCLYFLTMMFTSSCTGQIPTKNQKVTLVSDTLTKVQEYFENGNKLSEFYLDKERRLTGKWYEWNQNGVLKFEHNYWHGLRNGKQLSYNDSGKLELEYSYLDGLEDGDHILRDMHGTIIAHEVYKNGKLIKRYYIRDENSIRIRIGEFINAGLDSTQAIQAANDIARQDSTNTVLGQH